jgi:hypothetical protein
VSKRRELIVPTLRVVTALLTLRVFFSTRSVGGCMPTQSVGTMVSSVPIPESRASSPHGASKRRDLIVPTLRVVTALLTLRVLFFDAERRGLHAHAERGNDDVQRSDTGIASNLPPTGPQNAAS